MCDVDLQCASPASRAYQFKASKKSQQRPKKTWMEVIQQDIETKGLSEGILLDRNE